MILLKSNSWSRNSNFSFCYDGTMENTNGIKNFVIYEQEYA